MKKIHPSLSILYFNLVAVYRMPIGRSNYGITFTASTNGRMTVGLSLLKHLIPSGAAMIRYLNLSILCVFVVGCSARNYTHYLIEPAPTTQESFVEEGNLARPLEYGSTTMMKVRWNNGEMITEEREREREVELPLLATGQRVIIEHSKGNNGVETLPSTSLVPPPPSLADEVLVDAYRKRGLKLNSKAADISLTRARTLMEGALKQGNYQIALEWCQLVLARYPSHPEFLRAKSFYPAHARRARQGNRNLRNR